MAGSVYALEVGDGTLLLADWSAGLGRTLRADGKYQLSCVDVPGHPLLDRQGRPLAALPDAEQAVLNTVPEEIRRLAAPCGRFQWLALEAMRHVPGFSAFLHQETEGAGHGRAGVRRHRQHHCPCRPGIDSGLIDKARVRSFLGIGDF